MRIISKFSDYYDSVMKEGQDRSVVYVREKAIVEVPRKQESILPHVNSSLSVGYYAALSINNVDRREFMYLGFCGKIYPVLRIEFANEVNCFYSFEDVKSFCEEKGIEFRKSAYRVRNFLGHLDARRIEDTKYFFEQNTSQLSHLFHNHNVPCFIYFKDNNGAKLELNPNLKDLKFFKVKDTYSCFQDISMYVSGVLKSPENLMVKISDQDKLSKHGFDKWSFKKIGKNSKV